MLFDPTIFLEALVSPALIQGALTTIGLSICVQVTAFALCLPVAIGLSSKRAAVRWVLLAYVWLFRSAPMILVLLFIWNGLPQLFPIFRSSWFTPFLAAYIGMTLVGVAYNAEIMRAALGSLGAGQREAAAALGLTRFQAFRLVVLPQAMRIALPSLMNEFISLLKSTSLAYTISLRELMTTTSLSISASFRFTEWYACAFLYYLVMVSILTLAQSWIERRMSAPYSRKSNDRNSGLQPARTAPPLNGSAQNL
ncbi:amino acid ABC transporter permease [Mesorhizobium shangrilense]|uniref:Amino acid ABC transporter permease n=1 Tax=Mesorhizobium shangrilense TaxID=460060 RepID=A0ABV2DAS4_9HYPH